MVDQGQENINPEQSNRSRDDEGVPQELWRTGIWFSIFLIIGGLAIMSMANGLSENILLSIGTLSVCIGFGIALAVFGNRAGGKFLTFNVVGGGATAIALYMLLSTTPMIRSEKYLIGQILQTSMLEDVRVRARNVLLTGRTGEGSDFRFLIFENDLGEGMVRFTFEWPDSAVGGENENPKVLFVNCIKAEELREAIRQGTTIYLELEKIDGSYKLINTSNSSQLGSVNVANCSLPNSEPRLIDEVGSLNLFSFSAYAEEVRPNDLISDFEMLESESGELRDIARDKISSLKDPYAYGIMLENWDIANSSYRKDLGFLVAWSWAINRDRQTAVTLANSLSPEQLLYLVQLTGQGDITMRQLATEVLHRLLETTSWPNGPLNNNSHNIVEAVIEKLRFPDKIFIEKTSVNFSPDNSLYNTVVAIDFAACNISEIYRQQLNYELISLYERIYKNQNKQQTATKIQQLLGKIFQCA